MHEAGLVKRGIDEAIEIARHHRAKRVERLTFALPADGHVTQESVKSLVPMFARGTIVEGAEIAFEDASTIDPLDLAAQIAALSGEVSELTLVSVEIAE